MGVFYSVDPGKTNRSFEYSSCHFSLSVIHTYKTAMQRFAHLLEIMLNFGALAAAPELKLERLNNNQLVTITLLTYDTFAEVSNLIDTRTNGFHLLVPGLSIPTSAGELCARV